MPKPRQQGFTLIEIAIVLVIIGLIVGGVLMGQSLINAAAVRAQISQIEKYNTAAQTFYGKYGYLPGDIPVAPAAQFGFMARGQFAGEGDGNGVIEGCSQKQANRNSGYYEGGGETSMFWEDLSQAGLIDGTFNTAAYYGQTAATNIDAYMPSANIGQGNYIYVWSGGYGLTVGNADGNNYFGLSAVTALWTGGWSVQSKPALTVQQAYAIDTKIDDGYPQSGRNVAIYDTPGAIRWAAGLGIGQYTPATNGPSTSATGGSSTTCYDNGNVGGATQQYSLAQNGGAGVNCALSFRFQ